MSDQVEREGSNSIQFHNILAAALPVIKSKLFMNIDYGELDSLGTPNLCSTGCSGTFMS